MRRVRRLARRRRGVALLVVIGMLAMTLAVTYAMLRVQTTATSISQNQHRMGDARSAALTGMNVALAKIHTTAWAGVNSSLTGNLGTGLSYAVQFTSGDASLTPSSPNYADLPYRVTIRSTGTAVHPTLASVTSTHTIESVVQLVPRAMAATPAKWSVIQNHTVFQWGTDPVTFELPARVAGAVHAQGAMTLAPSYPTQDQRPFAGRIDEVAIFNKGLSATKILEIHQSALGLLGQSPVTVINGESPISYWRFNEALGTSQAADATNQNPGLYVGAKAGNTSVPFAGAGTSAQFDGLNDHVRGGRFDITTSGMTLLCWFRADSFPVNSEQHLIVKGMGPNALEQNWALGISTTSGIPLLYFTAATTNGTKTILDKTPLVTGVWTFAAGVYDGTRMQIYCNGVEGKQVGHIGSIVGNSSAFVLFGDTPPGSPRTRLLRDYVAMQAAGQTDMRPLTAVWNAPAGQLNPETDALLRDDLGITPQAISVDTSAPLTLPGNVGSYQLYAGGPLYSIPELETSLTNQSLVENPQSNPLGICKRNGNLDVLNSVSVRGTLLLYNAGNLSLKGTTTTWSAVPLPLIEGESTSRRLPAAIVAGSVRTEATSVAAQIQGAVIAGAAFEGLDRSDSSPGLTLTGRVVAKSLTFGKRANTTTIASDWRSHLQSFLVQSAQPYFPSWLATARSMNFAPLWTIQPDPSGLTDHWPNFTQPMFLVRSGDEGLRWRIVSWRDGL